MAVGGPDGRDPLLRQATVIAAFVLIGLTVFLAVAQVVGRVLISPSFDVGDFVFGTTIGALLAVLGIAGTVRLINRGDK